ncbi:RING-H2 finger protein [Amycolatopsis sp. SID8362]|uniref:RING finger protein n=1 Tax=Amycolatopsis sp. SID8362 TaxID=2690346 RepID=UPI00136E3C03|nr:RING-H2 finger protein [Amycolatopsis sp. SID8362]NBH02345.1 hypothetical protein [Amycolatopsis sp. SID8362]NED39048.1 E3 ubiquitin protein ligase [Amycolatopsis sp. SID8362]
MTTGVDQIRAWISEPLLRLRRLRQFEAATDWGVHFGDFLEQLGLDGDAPVAQALRIRLSAIADDADRDAFIASDEFEQIAYQPQLYEADDNDSGDDSAPSDSDYDAAVYETPAESTLLNENNQTAWFTFCAVHLPGWDRSEESWPRYSAGFVFEAGQRGFGGLAQELADGLTGLADNAQRVQFYDEYVSGCRSYGPSSDVDAVPDSGLPSEYPEAVVHMNDAEEESMPFGQHDVAWFQFCIRRLPAWRGTGGGTWNQFYERFMAEAENGSFGERAQALMLYSLAIPVNARRTYLNNMVNTFRATLEQYGLPVPAVDDDAVSEVASDDGNEISIGGNGEGGWQPVPPEVLDPSVVAVAPEPEVPPDYEALEYGGEIHESGTCSICLNLFVLDSRIAQSACGNPAYQNPHYFHWDCIAAWGYRARRDVCPLCRGKLKPPRRIDYVPEPIAAPLQASASESDEPLTFSYDADDWYNFCDTYLLALYDQPNQSWDQFSSAFLIQADEVGFGPVARDFLADVAGIVPTARREHLRNCIENPATLKAFADRPVEFDGDA